MARLGLRIRVLGICLALAAFSAAARAQSPAAPVDKAEPQQPETLPSSQAPARNPNLLVCHDTKSPARTALGACERALASDSLSDAEKAKAHFRRGYLFRTLRDYDRAIAEFDKALAFNVGAEQVLNSRGFAKADKGDFDGAVADYSESIRLQPRNSWAFNNRGNVHLNRGDADRAIADYDEALKIQKFAMAYMNRGRALTLKDDLDRARADLDEAIRLVPKFGFALSSRCRVQTLRNETDLALADCNAALALSPNATAALALRGDVYRVKDDLNAALADYDKALNVNPNFVPAYVGRGQLFEKRGDLNRARADYRSAAFALTRFDDIDTAQARIVARTRLNALSKAQGPVTPGRRIALVIGNTAYRSVSPLENPVRDAAMIAQTLRGTGFQTVTLANDLSRDKFFEALRAFAKDAESADWAVIYYAGHGLEIGGVNYLVPVDAKLKADRDAANEAVALEQVIASVQGARKLKLVILDACRDNPFVPKMHRSIALRLVNKGLSNIEPDAGFMVVYGAKAGETALDGEGAQNSPFATAIARNIKAPGIEMRKLFDIVRDDVMAATKKQQQPFSYGSLPGREDFYFVAAK